MLLSLTRMGMGTGTNQFLARARARAFFLHVLQIGMKFFQEDL